MLFPAVPPCWKHWLKSCGRRPSRQNYVCDAGLINFGVKGVKKVQEHSCPPFALEFSGKRVRDVEPVFLHCCTTAVSLQHVPVPRGVPRKHADGPTS